MGQHWSFDNPMIPDGEPVSGKTYRADGWGYFDFPRCSPAFWSQILERIGEGNFFPLALADYGTSKRGQLLISPEGMDRLQAWAAEEKAGIQ